MIKLRVKKEPYFIHGAYKFRFREKRRRGSTAFNETKASVWDDLSYLDIIKRKRVGFGPKGSDSIRRNVWRGESLNKGL